MTLTVIQGHRNSATRYTITIPHPMIHSDKLAMTLQSDAVVKH